VLWPNFARTQGSFFADLSLEITRESIAILLARGGGRRNCDKSQSGPTTNTAQLLPPNIGLWPILLKKSVSNLSNAPGHCTALDCEPLMVSGWLRAWHRYQLGQLSEVLGGCCEKELISRTIRPS
jgi:hypothetical protein